MISKFTEWGLHLLIFRKVSLLMKHGFKIPRSYRNESSPVFVYLKLVDAIFGIWMGWIYQYLYRSSLPHRRICVYFLKIHISLNGMIDSNIEWTVRICNVMEKRILRPRKKKFSWVLSSKYWLFLHQCWYHHDIKFFIFLLQDFLNQSSLWMIIILSMFIFCLCKKQFRSLYLRLHNFSCFSLSVSDCRKVWPPRSFHEPTVIWPWWSWRSEGLFSLCLSYLTVPYYLNMYIDVIIL